MERYDVAIIGAGLNGLATATYLARAGRSVAVFEASESVGGTMSTVEIAPGFLAPAAFSTVDSLHPAVMKELELKKHGLRLIEGGGTTVVSDADTAHHVDPNDPSLEELAAFVKKLGIALERVWTQPLPDTDPSGLAGIVDVLRLGWALRRMGNKDFPEALRFLPMSIQDALDENVSDDALKAAIAAAALKGAQLGPRSPGTAYSLVHHRPAWTSGLVPSAVYAAGGPGAVTQAAAAAARAAGAQILTDSPVTRVHVENDRVTGISVGDRLIEAKTVVSAVDPKTTLLGLVGARWLDPEFVEHAQHIRANGGTTVIRLALSEMPNFAGGEQTAGGLIQVGGTLDALERAYDASKYRTLPESPLLTCSIPSSVDSTLAPEGQHVMVIHAQFTPYHLDNDDWATAREPFADRVIATLDACAPGLAKSILHRQVESPVDLEERFGLAGGCLHHADLAMDQLLYMRPIPAWYGYRMPLDGLYLCGPGTHPGGAGTGLSGRNAAKQILAETKG